MTMQFTVTLVVPIKDYNLSFPLENRDLVHIGIPPGTYTLYVGSDRVKKLNITGGVLAFDLTDEDILSLQQQASMVA